MLLTNLLTVNLDTLIALLSSVFKEQVYNCWADYYN